MKVLTPQEAAKLAEEVYTVQDESMLSVFLQSPQFSRSEGASSLLNATVGFRLLNTKDAFAVCVKGREARSNELFLIFRGSTSANYGADWLSNARLGLERGPTGSLVHIGFNQILSSLLPQLKKFLAEHATTTGTIHCIGHSLGGAVATLVADWLKSHQSNSVKLYSFGAPRVGLQGFATQLTRKLNSPSVYRVHHRNDPVAMVPVFPYRHAPMPGAGYEIPYGHGVMSFAAHRVVNYVHSMKRASWLMLKSRPNPALTDVALQQWLTSDALDNAADPGVWQRASAALAWVLGKLSVALLAPLQMGFMGAMTLADRIALVLKRGIDLSKEVSFWVLRLMRRLTRLLGMKWVDSISELTQDLMRWILSRLIGRMLSQARQAVRTLIDR